MKETRQKQVLMAVCRPPGQVVEDELDTIAALGGVNRERDIHAVSLLYPNSPDPATDLNLDDYSAVIVGGSPFKFLSKDKNDQQLMVEDRVERLVRKLAETDKPTLAICYGFQAAAHYLGGKLTTDFAEEISDPQVTLTEAGCRDPLIGQLPEKFNVFLGHNISVATPPPDAVVLGTGEISHHQIFRLGNNFYGTQFHPELTIPSMMLRIDIYGDSYFKPGEEERVRSRCLAADVTNSNSLITRFFNRFHHPEHNVHGDVETVATKASQVGPSDISESTKPPNTSPN